MNHNGEIRLSLFKKPIFANGPRSSRQLSRSTLLFELHFSDQSGPTQPFARFPRQLFGQLSYKYSFERRAALQFSPFRELSVSTSLHIAATWPRAVRQHFEAITATLMFCLQVFHQDIDGSKPDEVWNGTIRPEPTRYQASSEVQPVFRIQRGSFGGDARLPVFDIRVAWMLKRSDESSWCSLKIRYDLCSARMGKICRLVEIKPLTGGDFSKMRAGFLVLGERINC